MIKGGYILQPRTVDDSEVAQFPPVTRELWHYLLRRVNHARNERLNINRGQGFFRLADIQDDLKWYSGYRKNTYSKPQLTKSLRRLREGNMVETTKETRGLLVTICNYDFYQDPGNYEGNDEETAKGSRRKSEGRTINKNVKNENNEKKKETLSAAKTVLEYLNTKSGKNFRDTETNLSFILERIKEGYKPQDFEKAVDNQVVEWGNDGKMNKFLRPSTLFQKSKFDGYVNNTKSGTGQSSHNDACESIF